ncbi:MAG: FprA family A-type flavoprotein [Candidatus Omnitrophica bacterium]|nr:FprA family A-type flavoprotein [Candidatus Omnitrophota bacterium]
MVTELKKGIYWVGGIDWDLRDFHGYLTQRGSTYNAYLIVDEKIVLVDTVKHYLYDEMLSNIRKIIDPEKIDYIVSNHVEMDHSGSLPMIKNIAKKAAIITSPNGEKGLKAHYKEDWDFKVVKTGDSISIGSRNLDFVLCPMVHWPDSMVTYIPEEKLLLPNDAFGQHIASSQRFDDQLGFDVLMEEAAKYYANIVLPFGEQVLKALEILNTLDIDMIAPSHGIIWRKNVPKIVEKYKKWASNETEKKAVIVYDSMWGSTKKMAYSAKDVLEENSISYRMMDLKHCHISDIITEILSAKYIFVGSPTLNNGVLPTVGAFLVYLQGLAPKNRTAIAFGSYGWGGQSVGIIEDVFEKIGFNIPIKGLKYKYIPFEKELGDFKDKISNCLTS